MDGAGLVAVNEVRLTLVRHGSTDWTVEKRFSGWSDVPLNTLGKRQAKLLGAHLHDRWTSISSSDLSRCAETTVLAGVEAMPDRRLRELDFGRLEGARWDELDADAQRALLDFETFRAPEGESVAQLGDRLKSFCEELEPGEHLVFTHGGPIRWFLHLCGAPTRGMIDPCDPIEVTLPARPVL
jgi:2,3-bisphosphoglycerate-dependent phosphoglycerate mutase